MRVFRKLVADSFIYGLAGMLLKLISFVTFPIFTRYFHPTDYATISLVSSVSLVLGTLSGWGLDSAAGRFFFDDSTTSYRNRLIKSWFIGRVCITFIFSLVFYIVYSIFLTGYFGLQSEYLSWLIISNLFLSIVPYMLNTLFVLYKRALLTLCVSVLLTLLSSIASLWFVVKENMGVTGFFAGQTLSFGFFTLAGVILYFLRVKKASVDFLLLKQMLIYGVKLLPGTLSNNFVFLIATIIIKEQLGIATLGIFQVGYTLSTLILFLTSGFSQAFVPHALQLNGDAFKNYCKQVFKFYAILLTICCLILALLMKDIIQLLLPSSYLLSWEVAGIMLFANFILSVGNIASIGFIKTKKIEFYGVITVIMNLSQLIFIYFFTFLWGLEGTSIALLANSFLTIILLFYYAEKVYRIKYNFTLPLSFIIGSVFLYFVAIEFDFSLLPKIISLLFVFLIIFFWQLPRLKALLQLTTENRQGL